MEESQQSYTVEQPSVETMDQDISHEAFDAIPKDIDLSLVLLDEDLFNKDETISMETSKGDVAFFHLQMQQKEKELSDAMVTPTVEPVTPPSQFKPISLSDASSKSYQKKYNSAPHMGKNPQTWKAISPPEDIMYNDPTSMQVYLNHALIKSGITPRRDIQDAMVREMNLRGHIYSSQIDYAILGMILERTNSIISSLGDINNNLSGEVSKLTKAGREISDSAAALKSDIVRMPNLLFDHVKNSLDKYLESLNIIPTQSPAPQKEKGPMVVPAVPISQPTGENWEEIRGLVVPLLKLAGFHEKGCANENVIKIVWKYLGKDNLLNYAVNPPNQAFLDHLKVYVSLEFKKIKDKAAQQATTMQPIIGAGAVSHAMPNPQAPPPFVFQRPTIRHIAPSVRANTVLPSPVMNPTSSKASSSEPKKASKNDDL